MIPNKIMKEGMRLCEFMYIFFVRISKLVAITRIYKSKNKIYLLAYGMPLSFDSNMPI